MIYSKPRWKLNGLERYCYNECAINHYLHELRLDIVHDRIHVFSESYILNTSTMEIRFDAVRVKLIDVNNQFYYAYHLSQVRVKSFKELIIERSIALAVDNEVVNGLRFRGGEPERARGRRSERGYRARFGG